MQSAEGAPDALAIQRLRDWLVPGLATREAPPPAQASSGAGMVEGEIYSGTWKQARALNGAEADAI